MYLFSEIYLYKSNLYYYLIILPLVWGFARLYPAIFQATKDDQTKHCDAIALIKYKICSNAPLLDLNQ